MSRGARWQGRRRRGGLTAALAASALLLLVAPVRAYEVVTFDGREIVIDALAHVDDQHVLVTAEGLVVLEPGEIDFYRTFARNLETGGNVLVFRNGGFLRFESVHLEDGAATIGIGGGGSIRVPELLIDFQASVLEGALVQLPEGAGGGVTVARARAAGPARGRDARGDDTAAARDAAEARADRRARARERVRQQRARNRGRQRGDGSTQTQENQ